MQKPLGVAGKAVIRKETKIILLQRSPADNFDPGLWELPGGKLEYGENLVDALSREVLEETGLLINVLQPFTTWHFLKEPFWVTGITFLCDYLDGIIRLSTEHQSHAWIEPKEYIHYPLSKSVQEQLKAYLEII